MKSEPARTIGLTFGRSPGPEVSFSVGAALLLALAAVSVPVGGAGVAQEDTMAVATFAGGCFWCMEPPYEKLEGVDEVVSGYTGGDVRDPTYDQVTSGRTGHVEAVQVHYDPDVISYDELLYVFWRNVDPTDAGGQFCDRGNQYRTGIFVHDEAQEEAARRSREELERSKPFDGSIVTEIRPLETFYRAEDYHQDYYRDHSIRYKFYRLSCGRDRVLRELWGEEAGGPAG
jgi:peptide methionine sulfoxide reductase msrA/msrB